MSFTSCLLTKGGHFGLRVSGKGSQQSSILSDPLHKVDRMNLTGVYVNLKIVCLDYANIKITMLMPC